MARTNSTIKKDVGSSIILTIKPFWLKTSIVSIIQPILGQFMIACHGKAIYKELKPRDKEFNLTSIKSNTNTVGFSPKTKK